MDQILPWVTAIASILGVLGLIGVAYVYVNSRVIQQTLDSQERRATTLEAELKVAQGVISRLETSDEVKTAKIASLETENTRLVELLSGRAEVEAIMSMIKQHHDDVMMDRQSFQQIYLGSQREMNDRFDALMRGLRDIKQLQHARRVDDNGPPSQVSFGEETDGRA